MGSLTDEEECLLGGGRWALTDAATWRAFAARSDDDRHRIARAVLRSLVESGQAWQQPGSERVDLAPALGLITAARTFADFLLVARTPETTPARAVPLGYALADDATGFRGLVVELRTPGWHDYRLLAVRRAAEGFVDWAQRAVSSDAWGSRAGTAVIEVLRPDEEGPAAAGLSVPASGTASALLLDGTRRRVEAADHEGLVATVETMVEQAVARGRGPRR